MLLPIGIAYNFTPYNWGLVAFFQQNLLSFYHLSNKSSGYVGLALRHPTICLPIASINWLNSACFLMDNIFISTQRRISNFSNSKSSRRSEEHTSELQSRPHLVCRLLLEKKNNKYIYLH